MDAVRFLGGLALLFAITLGLSLTVLAPSAPEKPQEARQHYVSLRWCHNEEDMNLSGVCSAIGKTWPI